VKKSIISLVLGILVLVIGIPFVTIGYMSVPQTREWIVNYSFPGDSLDTQHEHYNIGGVYSTVIDYHQDVIIAVDYGAPYKDHAIQGDLKQIFLDLFDRTREAKLSVIFTDESNHTLGVHYLVDVINHRVFFATPGPREIKIYLGSPLPLEVLQEKGCYGNWNVTFRSYHYPSLLDIINVSPRFAPYLVLILRSIAILTGICVVTISLKRISRDVTK